MTGFMTTNPETPLPPLLMPVIVSTWFVELYEQLEAEENTVPSPTQVIPEFVQVSAPLTSWRGKTIWIYPFVGKVELGVRLTLILEEESPT